MQSEAKNLNSSVNVVCVWWGEVVRTAAEETRWSDDFVATLPDFSSSALSVAAFEQTVTSFSIGGGDSEKDGVTAQNEEG